ncbi:MAG: hypothetical protein GXN99_02915 [Candidatus Nanohaloarchaeota archaeon]|nr:hypothetical protein [Candidatus Nanohaloarchaeota archaeon]
MKKLFLALTIIFIGSTLMDVFAIPVLVNIKESLTGHFSYFNYTFKGEVLELYAVWENIGSVTCDTYFMVKAYDSLNTSLGYFWSEKVNAPPGKAANFKLYVFIPNYNGSITLIPRLYYCNEIEDYSSLTIEKYNSTFMHPLPLNITYELYPDKIVFLFNESLKKEIYVVPVKQPPGWIIPSTAAPVFSKQVAVSYYRPKNSYKSLNFYFTDGYSGRAITVYFKDEWEKESLWQKLLSFLKKLF